MDENGEDYEIGIPKPKRSPFAKLEVTFLYK